MYFTLVEYVILLTDARLTEARMKEIIAQFHEGRL
jgi:hypothetical protein